MRQCASLASQRPRKHCATPPTNFSEWVAEVLAPASDALATPAAAKATPAAPASAGKPAPKLRPQTYYPGRRNAEQRYARR